MTPPRDPYRRHGDGPTDPPPRVLGAPMRPRSDDSTERPLSEEQLRLGLEEHATKRWQIIAGIVTLAASLLTSCGAGVLTVVDRMTPSASASSEEIAQLKKDLAETRKLFDESKVGAISGRLDAIDARLDAWQRQQDESTVRARKALEAAQLTGEAIAALNGRAPGPGWPPRLADEWPRPAGLPPYAAPMFTTSRAFVSLDPPRE